MLRQWLQLPHRLNGDRAGMWSGPPEARWMLPADSMCQPAGRLHRLSAAGSASSRTGRPSRRHWWREIAGLPGPHIAITPANVVSGNWLHYWPAAAAAVLLGPASGDTRSTRAVVVYDTTRRSSRLTSASPGHQSVQCIVRDGRPIAFVSSSFRFCTSCHCQRFWFVTLLQLLKAPLTPCSHSKSWLSQFSTGRRRLRSSNVPRTRTTLGDRSFTAAGPHLWNNLPLHLRHFELSLSEFRRLLKTHLFGWRSRRLVTYFYMQCALQMYLLTYLLTYLFRIMLHLFTIAGTPSAPITRGRHCRPTTYR